MELFKLFGTILIDDKDALNKLKQTDDKGKKTAESLNKIVEQGVKIGSAIYAGAGVAVGGMLSLADSASTTARDIDKFSKVAGFSTDSYQKWDYVMKNLGYSMEQASGDMAALAEKALDASMGAGEGAELFGMLGVAVTDSSGKLKSQEQIFEQTITALQNMTDETKRNAIASALMGTTGEELTPILSMNSQEIQNMKDKASELGLVMSGESIEAGKAFANNLNDVKSSFEAVKNNVARSFMPMLTNLLNWVLEHMPEIQEVAGKAFDFISATITFLTDNANILIPILGGLLGAFLALKVISVISGLMAVFNAVMLANPLTLVVLAIGAVVAGLIALTMNFDKAKAYALELWNKLSASFEGIKSKASEVFEKVKSVLLNPFITARDKIRDVIDTIKGYLDFKWSFPKLKMPHFKISNGSLNPLDWIKNGVPKLSVDWYAKGGIFSKPTIFNTPYGLKGVGDAKSPEVVAPLHELKEMLGLNDNKSEDILYYLRLIADKDNRVFLDGREITRGIYDYIEETMTRNSADYRLSTGGI